MLALVGATLAVTLSAHAPADECALVLSGNDHVAVPSSAQRELPRGSHGVSLWLRAASSAPPPTGGDGKRLVVAKHSAAESFRVTSDPFGRLTLDVEIPDASCTAGATNATVDALDGAWHMLSINYAAASGERPASATLILDDKVLVRCADWSAREPRAAAPASEGLMLGGCDGTDARSAGFAGALADVRIWPSPLTSEMAAQVYHAGPICLSGPTDMHAADDDAAAAPAAFADASASELVVKGVGLETVPERLLRCLQSVTVGIDVHDEALVRWRASETVLTSKTIVSQHIFDPDSVRSSPTCAELYTKVAGTVERTLTAERFVEMVTDAVGSREGGGPVGPVSSSATLRPHTHLFTLAKTDPQLLDDATQVLVMGIMAGTVASICSLLVGLGIGCWAGHSVLAAAVAKKAKRVGLV